MPSRSGSTGTADVKRDLLAGHLRSWVPAALHRARRVTYAHGYADLDGGLAAEAALGVFLQQSDLVRGRELVMLAVGDDPAAVGELRGVHRAASAPAALAVHTVGGGTDARLGVALKAVGAARVPLLGFLDASAAAAPPTWTTVAALTAGRPAEAIVVLAATLLPALLAGDVDPASGAAAGSGADRGSGADGDGGADPGADALRVDGFFGGPGWRAVGAEPVGRRRAFLVDQYRSALQRAGFPLVTMVELVAGDDPDGELLVFAGTSGKSLEGFKEALWAVDVPGCVRYRDPADPERRLLNVSPSPDLAPLRRTLQGQVQRTRGRTVAELRTFTSTDTVYRAADANRVVSALIAAGQVLRTPAHGRLGGDVVVTPAEPAVRVD